MLRRERDYILRQINQAAIAVARLRERLRESEQPDEIVEAARAAQGELLGQDAALLRALDPSSAARVMGDAQLVSQWADLLRVEAEAHRKAGRSDDAALVEQRADALRR